MINNYNPDGTAPIRREGTTLIAVLPTHVVITLDQTTAQKLDAKRQELGRPLTASEVMDVLGIKSGPGTPE